LHPFTYGGETQHYAPGEALVLSPWGELLLAPLICYDLRFPETFRAAVTRGAQLFAVIANWPESRVAHWLTLLKARAIENQCYVAGVNRCGSDPRLIYPGHSVIIDPRGETLAEAGADDTIIQAGVDLASLTEYRRTFPALEDIRPIP
jgi:predicted amidohydrolase